MSKRTLGLVRLAVKLPLLNTIIQIFYSDGVNIKIEIEALSVGSESAMFRISLPTELLTIPDNAFDGKLQLKMSHYTMGQIGVVYKQRLGLVRLIYNI